MDFPENLLQAIKGMAILYQSGIGMNCLWWK